MISSRLPLIVAFLALLAGACSTADESVVEMSGTPNSVVVTSGTGNVTVTAGDSDISVTAAVSASGDEPMWSADLVGTELTINDACGDRDDCRVDFNIVIPGTADLTINSADGGITIANMNSRITVTGSASNILLNGITGPISVDVAKGDLLGARLVSTDASFRSGEGEIDVTLTDVFTSLTVDSGSGDITVQVPDGGYDIDATSDSGEVDVKVNHVEGAQSTIVMHTGKGDVTIYRR